MMVRMVPVAMAGYLVRNTPAKHAAAHAKKVDQMVMDQFMERTGLKAVDAKYRELFSTELRLGLPLKLGGLGLRQSARTLHVASLARTVEEGTLQQVEDLLSNIRGDNVLGVVTTLEHTVEAIKDMNDKGLWLSNETKKMMKQTAHKHSKEPAKVFKALKLAKEKDEAKAKEMDKKKRKGNGGDDASCSFGARQVYKFQHTYTQRQERKEYEGLVLSLGGNAMNKSDTESMNKKARKELKKKQTKNAATKYKKLCKDLPVFKHNPNIVKQMHAHTLAVASKDTSLVFLMYPDSGETEVSNAAMMVAMLLRLLLPLAAMETCLQRGAGDKNASVPLQDRGDKCEDCYTHTHWTGGIGSKPVAAFPLHCIECVSMRKLGSYDTHRRVQHARARRVRSAGTTASVVEDPGKAKVPERDQEELRQEMEKEWAHKHTSKLRKLVMAVEPDFVMSWRHKLVWGDVSLINPTAKSHVAHEIYGKKKGVGNPSARAREMEKIKKYEPVQRYLSGKHALGIAGRPIEMVPAVMETTGAFGDKLIEFIEAVHRMPTWSGPRDENFVLNTKRCLAAALYEGVAESAMRMTWRMLHGKHFNRRQYHGRGGHGYKSGEDACRRLPAAQAGHL
jgi:hypothetical protein